MAALPTGGSPLPDMAGALPGDDGTGPLPLGTINDAPNPDRLDFLFEFCWPECFRDAHWMDPKNPTKGSGVWTAGRPFHVREGFINNREAPLGDGFDVVLYVTRMGDGGDEATYRYTSDYVMRGTSDRCGPTYETQTGPATCEWFVHDFPDGLPEGRFAIWAVWEAPCRAWIDMALTDECQDPDEVISLFSSGFDAPYTDQDRASPRSRAHSPRIRPKRHARIPQKPRHRLVRWTTWRPCRRAAARFQTWRGHCPATMVRDPCRWARSTMRPTRTASTSCSNSAGRSASATRTGWTPRTRPWALASGRPAVRSTSAKGSSTTGRQPLGDGFDVVLYVTRMGDGGDEATYRYTSDYVMRGTSDRCGPTYETQTGPATCEWFVHDFPDGLPEGRFAIWAVWEAPCRAWIDLALTDECQDPDEVISLFSSGFDAPYTESGPSFTEVEGPFTTDPS